MFEKGEGAIVVIVIANCYPGICLTCALSICSKTALRPDLKCHLIFLAVLLFSDQVTGGLLKVDVQLVFVKCHLSIWTRQIDHSFVGRLQKTVETTVNLLNGCKVLYLVVCFLLL